MIISENLNKSKFKRRVLKKNILDSRHQRDAVKCSLQERTFVLMIWLFTIFKYLSTWHPISDEQPKGILKSPECKLKFKGNSHKKSVFCQSMEKRLTLFVHHVKIFVHYVKIFVLYVKNFVHYVKIFVLYVKNFVHHVKNFVHYVKIFVLYVKNFVHHVKIFVHYVKIFVLYVEILR